MNYRSIILISSLFFTLFISACQAISNRACCQFIAEGLEYDLQCRNLNDKFCLTIGKVVRLDAPALISFSKYQKLEKSQLDTIYQTNLENYNSSITMDTIIYRKLKLENYFTYSPNSFEIANNIKIFMEADFIKIIYGNRIEYVKYENISKVQINKVMESLSE